MMSSKNVYAKECSSKSSLLLVIPEADNKPRVAGITKCYFIMAGVSSVSMIFAILLFILDGKAVRIHEAKEAKKEAEQKALLTTKEGSEEPTKTSFKEIMIGFKVSALLIIKNDKVIALYLMCICFYVGVFTFISQASTFFNEYHGIQAVVAGSITGAIYTLAVPLNFACGALVSSVDYQQGFLALAFVLSTLAHFIMMSVKSSVAAYAGVVLLAFGYSFIGSTMWPLAGELLPDKYNGQVYGFMYAFQQAGMTIASKVVGMLKDTGGWLALQMFFTVLQLIGLGLALYLISRIGLHRKEKEEQTDEQIPMREAEEKENMKEENEN
jgi:Na+/melibiose symporter-like transporter